MTKFHKDHVEIDGHIIRYDFIGAIGPVVGFEITKGYDGNIPITSAKQVKPYFIIRTKACDDQIKINYNNEAAANWERDQLIANILTVTT